MKKIFALLTAVIIFCAVATPVFAETEVDYVLDSAGILSAAEESRLEEKAAEAKEKYGCDIGIYTVDFGSEIVSDYEAQWLAEDYYNDAVFSDNGILLMIFFDNDGRGGTYIATAGECIDIFYDDLLGDIEDNFYNYLSDRDYYNATLSFVSDCSDEITDYYSFNSIWFLLAPGIGIVIAFIAVGSMKGQLKSVRSKPNASDYTKAGSMKLTASNDIFLYRKVTRTPKPQNNSPGSSSHTGSGGRSFGGHSGRRF